MNDIELNESIKEALRGIYCSTEQSVEKYKSYNGLTLEQCYLFVRHLWILQWQSHHCATRAVSSVVIGDNNEVHKEKTDSTVCGLPSTQCLNLFQTLMQYNICMSDRNISPVDGVRRLDNVSMSRIAVSSKHAVRRLQSIGYGMNAKESLMLYLYNDVSLEQEPIPVMQSGPSTLAATDAADNTVHVRDNSARKAMKGPHAMKMASKSNVSAVSKLDTPVVIQQPHVVVEDISAVGVFQHTDEHMTVGNYSMDKHIYTCPLQTASVHDVVLPSTRNITELPDLQLDLSSGVTNSMEVPPLGAFVNATLYGNILEPHVQPKTLTETEEKNRRRVLCNRLKQNYHLKPSPSLVKKILKRKDVLVTVDALVTPRTRARIGQCACNLILWWSV